MTRVADAVNPLAGSAARPTSSLIHRTPPKIPSCRPRHGDCSTFIPPPAARRRGIDRHDLPLGGPTEGSELNDTTGRGAGTHLKTILPSVAVIAFTLGFAFAAWDHVDDERYGGTYAGLFGPPVMDLRLEGDAGVHAFLSHPNLAPGDRIAGTLRIIADRATVGDVYDLDFDVRLTSDDVTGHSLDEALEISCLAYGRDDLLSTSDGGRDLVREIDGNPILGNGDGRLSLHELQAGANDLPAPTEAGTPFVIELLFRPPAGVDPNAYQRLRAGVDFHFHLADTFDSDLN